LLNWISSWIADHTKRVCFNGRLSRWRKVTIGVPQGSVLGPILFLIYINDLDDGIVNWILTFADNIKVLSGDDSLSLHKDLDRLFPGLGKGKMQSDAYGEKESLPSVQDERSSIGISQDRKRSQRCHQR